MINDGLTLREAFSRPHTTRTGTRCVPPHLSLRGRIEKGGGGKYKVEEKEEEVTANSSWVSTTARPVP